MVRFDASLLRYLDEEDFRVLAAVELASRNHEIAPAILVEKIAGLNAGGARKRLRWLLKHNFLLHDCKFYDGYRMNYMAYDYLAMRTFVKRGSISHVGNKIGVGKESDVFVVANEDDREMVMKLQRLGRTSFRTVKKNRDYKNGRAVRGESWFYLSRLAAIKEYSFMQALHAEGFPVPEPIDHNRHVVVMEKIQGTTLTNVKEIENANKVFKDAIDLIIRFAQYGLIHGDFNEFNLMLTDDDELIVIDFPQMTSTSHPNAKLLFDRDVKCIHDFFRRRFKIHSDYVPELHVDTEKQEALDKKVQATGYNKGEGQSALESLLQKGDDADSDSDSDSSSDADDDVAGRTAKRAAAAASPAADDAAAEGLAEVLKELSVSEKPRENDDGRHEDDDDEEEDMEELEEVEEYDSEEERQRKKELKALKKAKQQSAASTVATRRVPRSKVGGNYTVSESGCTEINKEHLKARVTGIMRREEMREVVRVCKKNTQKPRDKRRTKMDINSARRDLRATGHGGTDGF
eukprot:TRINITY_DN304_c1_g1_i1.p2 TRINITY_DN304_c1_g1~~TRINITY_DN304_c1_g1_i1.p2  ORF type:complete len:518 (+),score=249.33 TRINITY_DN304_c1_g1_i1:78-1631(+)